MAHQAQHVNAPKFSWSGLVAQRREGNGYLNLVPVFHQTALRLHHHIDTKINSLPLGENSVALHAQRIEQKHISTPSIVEGIEPNGNVVVSREIITLRYG